MGIQRWLVRARLASPELFSSATDSDSRRLGRHAHEQARRPAIPHTGSARARTRTHPIDPFRRSRFHLSVDPLAAVTHSPLLKNTAAAPRSREATYHRSTPAVCSKSSNGKGGGRGRKKGRNRHAGGSEFPLC